MKKKRSFSFLGVFSFFLLIAGIVTVAMLLYGYVDKKSDGNQTVVAVSMFLVIVFLALLCTVIDLFRRKLTEEKRMDRILQATEKIANGDFSVRLTTSPSKYFNPYDEIMENINLLASELGKSEVLKTDFISNVSHEIKTPLAVIQTYSQMLAKKDLDEKTRIQYAETLQKTTKRLNELVVNILKLNKLENQKLRPELTTFSLTERLEDCVLAFEERIEEKRLELSTYLDEVTVFSSVGYLDIVWSNLLSNAIKFTNDGGRVALSLKKEGVNVRVSVTDTGVGIDRETGQRIFDKFYQGDTSHSAEGNGLGLALVKKVVDVLGGEIYVESERGKGSTFSVLLKNVVV